MLMSIRPFIHQKEVWQYIEVYCLIDKSYTVLMLPVKATNHLLKLKHSKNFIFKTMYKVGAIKKEEVFEGVWYYKEKLIQNCN